MSNPSEAKCPRCAAPLPPSAPEGLCPRCLGALNLATDTVLTGADAIAAQPPLTPAELAPHFPQLEIIECLGRGGMGVVYRVRQKALNRLAALKLLAPERVTDAGFAERFTREAQALARLNHPNIVTIYDFGATTPPQTPDAISHPPFYFLLMEFMDGVNLRQAMKAGRFTPEQALAIVPPVCEALQYAHEQGIVHRDIKPENLLLDKAGRLKIADFGIAKILEPGRAELPLGQLEEAAQQRGPTTPESFTAGTPGYMAPEQKSAPQRVDSRADIYSLGVVIYEMLTGELPAAQLQPPSRKVQIDVRLDEIVLRALEQRPELRFQTAAELRTQVETVVSTPHGGRGEEAKASSTPPRFLKVGTSTLTTPAELATASGQFFCHRTRGQLILDDRQLTHSLAGTNTVIPLAAIRDVSIGQYPRSMNPAGISLLSLTYEDGGQRRQILLSPMEGWFAFPSTWDARVAEWHAAIRSAVTTATGRAPASTPPEKLGVPGSHFALVAMMILPVLVPSVVLVFVLTRLSASGDSAGRSSLLAMFVFGMVLLGFLLPLLFGRRTKISPDSGAPSAAPRSPWRIALGVLALLAVLPVAALLTYFLSRSTPSGVTHFDFAPVGVSNNVVIVDVTTEVGRGNAELRAMLDGPRLPVATEAALADAFFPPFAGTFIKPTTHAGNHPWRILSPGRQTWRLGFVLPDEALAKDAMENLHPVGPLPAVPDRTYAGTLFEVRQTNGQVFHATLQVALPFTSADTNWVSVSTMATYNESIVTMNWEVLAAQPGTARCQREGNRSTAQLQLDAKSKLYRVPVRIELTKVSTNRVLLVTEAGGSKSREELTGSFRELSAELVRFINLSAKTVRGAEIELCQFQGKPFTVQVDAAVPPAPQAGRTGASRWGFSGTPNFTVWAGLAGVVVLGVVTGGIVLLVVLVRKGGNGGKIALLLVGAAGLFLAVAVAALFGWRKMASDFGPGVGLVRLAKSGQMTLESNYPAPAQPHPPGRVQQTQNGFRLQLPAAQVASLEFFIRQGDDSLQPVPSLTALVATSRDGGYHDTLYWTLRRGNNTDGNHSTNQLWFWTVSLNANSGRPLPQLADHGTNFAHHVPHGEALDWWQLAVPATVTLKPGEQTTIPLFRTHGTATAGGKHPKEAFLRVRCEPLPTNFVGSGVPRVELGLAAQAELANRFALTNAVDTATTTGFKAARLTWQPNFPKTGVKPDMNDVRDQIQSLTKTGDYEAALQRQLWYYFHAEEFESSKVLRLSFGIMHWKELGARYPKARAAMVEIRDDRLRQLQSGTDTNNFLPLMQEVAALNRELGEDGATLTTFKAIAEQDEAKAKRCYFVVERALVAAGDYALCRKFMGDPQQRFDLTLRSYQMSAAMYGGAGPTTPPLPALPLPGTNRVDAGLLPPMPPPSLSPIPRPMRSPIPTPSMSMSDSMKRSMETSFVDSVRLLVEILVGTGDKALAEKFRDQAAAVLPHVRLNSAIADAEARIRERGASAPRATTPADSPASVPQHIEFKALRVENPPGTRDILLHFERDTNYGLALEVSQDVTPSPGLRKQPQPGHRTWQQTTWVGVHDHVLGWTLPQEFTAAEVRAVVKDMEQRTKTMRQLPDGAVPEFATAIHRDGWKYHLIARVKHEPGAANPPPKQPGAAPLVRREVKQANPGGKDLVMTFEELRRDERTSTATVKHVSGAAAPSAMFIARGAYDIARARGAAYFLNLKEWDAEDGTRMYLIGFAPDKNVDLNTYFDLKEPLPADKRLLFLPVSLYERIFKDQP